MFPDHGRGLCGTAIMTLLDMRVPQPGRYEEYSVPAVIIPAIDALYAQRNACTDDDVLVIDDALFRLVWPWIKAPA